MGILEKLVLFPTAEHWPLLDHLMLLMLVFFLPFAGIVLFSTLGSLIFRGRHPGLGRDLARLAVRNAGTWAVFGLVPLLCLVFLYTQYMRDGTLPMGLYMLRILGLFVVAMVALLLYERRGWPLFGAAGAFFLAGSVFHLIASIDLLAYPEKWPLTEVFLPMFFSVQVFVDFSVFLALSISLTGAAILLLLFQWPERDPATPEHDRPLLRRLGLTATIFGAVGIGPLVMWDFYSAPIQSLSPDVYAMGFLSLLALLIVTAAGIVMARAGHSRFGWLAFLLIVLAFGLFSHKEQVSYANAGREHERVMVAVADSMRAVLVESREELYGAGQEVSLALGEEIYTSRCTACHAWDQKIVGPPYNSVLPKYESDLDGLQAFVRNPVKVDPAYPAMPSQGLKRSEARSVAAYLLSEFTGENPLGDEAAGGASTTAGEGAGAATGAGGEAGAGGMRDDESGH